MAYKHKHRDVLLCNSSWQVIGRDTSSSFRNSVTADIQSHVQKVVEGQKVTEMPAEWGHSL